MTSEPTRQQSSVSLSHTHTRRTHARSLYCANCSPRRYVADGEGADRNPDQSTIPTDIPNVGNLFLFFVCRFDGESFRVSGGLMQRLSNVFLAYRRHNTKHANQRNNNIVGTSAFAVATFLI
jgi:hypothetical protein